MRFLNQLGSVQCPCEVLADVDSQVFKTAHPLHFKLSDKQWLVSSLLFPQVHYHLLCLVCVEGEIVVLTPCHKTGHLLPVGRFVIACDASYHCGVISELQNGVAFVCGNTVMCEQCVEDGAENATLWGANICNDCI